MGMQDLYHQLFVWAGGEFRTGHAAGWVGDVPRLLCGQFGSLSLHSGCIRFHNSGKGFCQGSGGFQ